MNPITLIKFILANYPTARDWDPAKFYAWILWNLSEGFIAVAFDNDENIAGLGIAHPTMSKDPNSFDYEGPCVYCDLAIATVPGALQLLFFTLLKRFGQRKFVAWNRISTGHVKQHSLAAFRRNLFRTQTKPTFHIHTMIGNKT